MGQKEVLELLGITPVWWSMDELKTHFKSGQPIYRVVKQLVRYRLAVRYISLTGKWYIRGKKWDGLGERPNLTLTGELL